MRSMFKALLGALGAAGLRVSDGPGCVVVGQRRPGAINVAQQAGVLVKLTLKQPLAAPPASFSVASPARIAFDFPRRPNRHRADACQTLSMRVNMRSVNSWKRRRRCGWQAQPDQGDAL